MAGILARSKVLAEQEGENLSGLSTNPDKGIYAVRENGTTCLMVEFAVRFVVPYDVLALNGIDVRVIWFFLELNANHGCFKMSQPYRGRYYRSTDVC